MAFTPGMSEQLSIVVKSDGADDFRNSMSGATSSLFSFKAAVGAAGAALAAFSTGALLASINAARKFESAMVEVQKVTDPETAEAMTSEIKDMAETIPLAQTELAGLAADAARFGIRGPENIRQFTETVARMATATDLSTEEAGQSMAKLATLTETPVSEMENLGSAINTLSNNFATSSGEIVDSMLRGSAALSQFGLNQKQIAGMSAALNEVSASSRRAGTRLRRVAQELMEPKKVKKVADALGLSVEQFETMRDERPAELFIAMAETMREGGKAADALRTSVSSASRQALAGLGQNLEGTREALTTSNEAYSEATSLQREFEAQTETLDAQLQLLKNNLVNEAIAIGNVFLPAITDAVEAISEFIASGDTVLDALSAQEKAWGLVAGAVGGAAIAIAAFVSGPLALLVGAAATAAAAYATNFMGIKDATDEAIGGAIDAAKQARDRMAPMLERTAGEAAAAWRVHGDEVLTNVRDAFSGVAAVIGGWIDFVVQNLYLPFVSRASKIYDRHLGELVGEFLRTFNIVADRVRWFVNTFALPLWNKFGDEFLAVARFAFDAILSVIGTALDATLTTIRVVLALIRGDWQDAWNLLGNFAERVLGGLVSFISTWGSGLLAELKSALRGAFAWAKGAVSGFVTWVEDALKGVGQAVATAIETAINDTLGLPFTHTIGRVEVGGETVFAGEQITIPALAEGGVVQDETLAMLGESGPEAVVPLGRRGPRGAVQGGDTTNRFDITVNVPPGADGRQIANDMADELESLNIRGTGL